MSTTQGTKITEVNVGDYIRSPRNPDKIMQVYKKDTPDTLYARNIAKNKSGKLKNENDILVLTGSEARVLVVSGVDNSSGVA